MKTQAFNPFLPSYEYIPERSLMYSETGCMSTKVMTGLTRRIFEGMIMCAGQRRLMIWGMEKDRVIYRSVQDPLNEDGT